MPYIKQEDRPTFANSLFTIPRAKTKGELEYCIFYLMKMFISHKDFTYTNLHDCVYAAQHCADEFRRRFLDKREDEAREENGDV